MKAIPLLLAFITSGVQLALKGAYFKSLFILMNLLICQVAPCKYFPQYDTLSCVITGGQSSTYFSLIITRMQTNV